MGLPPLLIDRIEAPDPDAYKAILGAIDGYNDEASGRAEPAQVLAILVRDKAGAVRGGLWGISYYDWLHVDLLFLPEDLRRGGMGRRVMQAAERVAVMRKCNGIWLDTMSFQAPGFYRKLGYSVFGQIDSYVPGETRFWLKKSPLADWPADAALDVTATPKPVDREPILNGLMVFNDAHCGPPGRQVFGLALRERADGPILGGLWAISSRRWMFIELLILPGGARRQGLGTRLMAIAEEQARAQGCRGIFLDTFSFQARGFYERLGYAVYGEIEDYPAPHRRFLLSKGLDDAARLIEGAREQPPNLG